MALVRRSTLLDPWQGMFSPMLDLHRQLDDFTRQTMGQLTEAGTFIPVDVLERDGNLVVRAELPGIDPERDVDLSIEDGALAIRGERRQEERKQDEHFFRLERRYGSFHRVVPIPSGVKEEDIKASYENGVLEVVVPGPAQLNGAKKKIPIQIGEKLKSAIGAGKKE